MSTGEEPLPVRSLVLRPQRRRYCEELGKLFECHRRPDIMDTMNHFEQRPMASEVDKVEQDLRKVHQSIDDVERKIVDVDERIGHVEAQLMNARGDDIIYFRGKEKLLRKEKGQLRKQTEQLREIEQLLREKELVVLKADRENELHLSADKSEKLPEATEAFELFVKSAAHNYQEWERADKAAVGNNFLAMARDPLGVYPGEILIWIRKAYKGMMEIILRWQPGRRYIVLGTAGIGKSVFTLFWICYRATLKEKVVWKLSDGAYYLLDFSQESANAYGPFGHARHPVLQQVLHDPAAWLIIDGKERDQLHYPCHMLLACSPDPLNFEQFDKNGMCCRLYCPVWTEEEITGFLDDFEVHRSKFSNMGVPDRETALQNFGELGGVARYALCDWMTSEGKQRLASALAAVTPENFLALYSGVFLKDVSDSLSHIFVDEGSTDSQYDFASSWPVRKRLQEVFEAVDKSEVVKWMERNQPVMHPRDY